MSNLKHGAVQSQDSQLLKKHNAVALIVTFWLN